MTPSKAFMKSPTDASGVGIGVAQGTVSLFSHSASGFFGFWAKVSATVGHLLAYLTLDPDFRTWHRDKIETEATNLNREWKRRGVQSVQATLTRPIIDLGLGVVGGISGIVLLPVKGYRRDGGFGLAKGVVGGVSGIIVKPLIGVFDASVHFAASIHDIAKSVNVLDKRLQPALRHRLPYTFGIMLILAPFNKTAARAVQLLKRFPIKRWRFLSAPVSETLIHVEVLPNATTDTYMIVSSLRVILIRVRKESSGSLTPSLCWEVALANDSKVSSQVSENGHTGIALTLQVRKQTDDGDPVLIQEVPIEKATNHSQEDDQSRSEEERETGRVQFPTDPEALATKMHIPSVDDMSPFDLHNRVDGEGGEYHGTVRGAEGELLEWFSVLAEYQYRPQLARLHNAISCMAKDFEAVIRDPSLGRPGSTEGYTSFGMFYFEPTDPQEPKLIQDSTSDVMQSLDVIPWTYKGVFNELSGKSPDEQREVMLELKKNRDFDYELRQSELEGGPEWLIIARAEATFYDADPHAEFLAYRDEGNSLRELESDDASSGDGSDDQARFIGIPIPKKIKRWASNPLPAIPDGGILENFHFSSPFKRGEASNGKNKDEVEEANPTDESTQYGSAPTDSISKEILVTPSQSFHTAADSQSMAPSELSSTPMDSSDNVENRQRLTNQESFMSAVSSHELSLRPSTEIVQDRFYDPPDRASDMTPIREESGESLIRSTSQPRRPPVPTAIHNIPQPNLPGDWASAEYEVTTRYQMRRQDPSSNDRIERMEGLMERLLIFSSEQALQRARPGGPSGTPETDHLIDEIAELRSRLDIQSSREMTAQTQVSELRRELASLKAVLIERQGGPIIPQRDRAATDPAVYDATAVSRQNTATSAEQIDPIPSSPIVELEATEPAEEEFVTPTEPQPKLRWPWFRSKDKVSGDIVKSGDSEGDEFISARFTLEPSDAEETQPVEVAKPAHAKPSLLRESDRQPFHSAELEEGDSVDSDDDHDKNDEPPSSPSSLVTSDRLLGQPTRAGPLLDSFQTAPVELGSDDHLENITENDEDDGKDNKDEETSQTEVVDAKPKRPKRRWLKRLGLNPLNRNDPTEQSGTLEG